MKQGLKALIVDDNVDDAVLMVIELQNADFEVVWKRTDSAADLTALLLAEDWDILLSDYSMPQFNALDVLKIIKELQIDVPTLIVSGAIGEDAAVACVRAGACDFFVKANLGRFSAAVRRHLAEVATLRQSKKLKIALEESEALRWEAQQIALAQEIESRKKMQVLLFRSEESNRQKEEFLTVLSHELRTPMNAITGWSEMLAKKECRPQEYPEIFEAILRNAHAQNKLINDLLDLSRITVGKLEIEKAPVYLQEVLLTALESIKILAQPHSISITLKNEYTRDTVSGDRQRLLEVFWNLLSNAIKFTPDGGSIEIRANRLEEIIEVTVQDTGQGISLDFLPFVFDKFRQEKGSLNRKHGGLGLGLSLVKNLVELHGGETHAFSEGPGKGAIFIVRLPILKRDETPVKEAVSILDRLDLKGLHVLIVDDHSDSLVLLGRRLQGYGIDAVSTLSASVALQLFKENPPDIFLSDIEMPEMNGYELIAEIREFEKATGRRVPCAAITAHARPEDVERALTAGFDLHIAKPIDKNRLYQAIVNLTGASAAELAP